MLMKLLISITLLLIFTYGYGKQWSKAVKNMANVTETGDNTAALFSAVTLVGFVVIVSAIIEAFIGWDYTYMHIRVIIVGMCMLCLPYLYLKKDLDNDKTTD